MKVKELFYRLEQETNKNYTQIEIGNFMDEFYDSEIEDIQEIISEEPCNADKVREIDRVFIAGFVEYYCNRLGVNKPEWIFKDIYKCSRNTFYNDHHTRETSIWTLLNTPKEFFNRNLFLEVIELSRV